MTWSIDVAHGRFLDHVAGCPAMGVGVVYFYPPSCPNQSIPQRLKHSSSRSLVLQDTTQVFTQKEFIELTLNNFLQKKKSVLLGIKDACIKTTIRYHLVLTMKLPGEKVVKEAFVETVC